MSEAGTLPGARFNLRRDGRDATRLATAMYRHTAQCCNGFWPCVLRVGTQCSRDVGGEAFVGDGGVRGGKRKEIDWGFGERTSRARASDVFGIRRMEVLLSHQREPSRKICEELVADCLILLMCILSTAVPCCCAHPSSGSSWQIAGRC